MLRWCRGLILLVFFLAPVVSLPAWAQQTPSPPKDSPKVETKAGGDETTRAAPSPLDVRRLKWGFAGFGLLFGFFLSYSIRSGSKTQDVFKSLTGVLGAGGGTATAALIGEPYRVTVLGAYTLGAIAGFVAYLLVALILVSVFAHAGNETWKRWAEVLGRVLLGEEFSPPPKPGTSVSSKPAGP
jgi:hypothetical protein